MAIFNSTPITEGVRQSISNQTFAIVRGQNVARKKISRNSSKTVPQQQQRARMKRIADVEELFELSSEIGFPKRPATWTTANAFTSANLKNGALTVDDTLEVTVDYAQILCSQGRRKLPRKFTVTADAESRTLTFTHSVELRGRNRNVNDKLYAMVVAPELEDAELFDLGTRAESEPMTINVPEGWDMASLEIYVFALSPNGRIASDSRHLTVE